MGDGARSWWSRFGALPFRTQAGVLFVAAGIVLSVLFLVLGGSQAPLLGPVATQAPPSVVPGFRPPLPLFSPDSVWNRALPADAPVDATSAPLIQQLLTEVGDEQRQDIGPYIATSVASTPLYVVPSTQPTVPIALDPGLSPGHAALQAAFSAVPIPPEATPAEGPDRHLTVWQPSTDRLWELFKARRVDGGWAANWGGAIAHVSEFPGYFTPAAWPGATPNWGATATSLPVIAGTMRLSELAQGHIDHALAINLPSPRAGVFAWPAQRSDGTGAATELPEGARLRLDPALDLSRLQLPRLTRMMAEAAQRYGIIVRDQTHHAIGFFAEDPDGLTTNPYLSADGFFGGQTPNQLLAVFPWQDLQVLKMHLCTAAPCPPA